MSLSPQPFSQDDRRTAPRIDVNGKVTGRLEPDTQPVTVRDLSLGGFLIESEAPFPVDAIHQFRLATPAGWDTMLTARSVHCQKRTMTGSYLTGFAFVQPTGVQAHEAIVEMMEQVASIVTFGEK